MMFAQEEAIPAALCGGGATRFPGKGCRVAGFGKSVTAIEVGRQ